MLNLCLNFNNSNPIYDYKRHTKEKQGSFRSSHLDPI